MKYGATQDAMYGKIIGGTVAQLIEVPLQAAGLSAIHDVRRLHLLFLGPCPH